MSRHTFSAVTINKAQGRDGMVLSQRVTEGSNALLGDDCAGKLTLRGQAPDNIRDEVFAAAGLAMSTALYFGLSESFGRGAQP